MPDLDTSLQQFATFIENELPPPDVEQLVATAPARPKERFRWRPVVVLVAAGLTLLTVGVPLLVLGVFSSAPVVDDPVTTTTVPVTTTTVPATTTPPSTTTAVPETPEAIALGVEAAQDAVSELHDLWNSGNVEAFIAMLGHPGAFSGTDRVRHAIAIQDVAARLETDCQPGISSGPGTVEIDCVVGLLDDRFYTPAGIRWTRQVTYVVSEDGIDTDTGYFWTQGPSGDAREYLIAFDQWLFERYQDGQPLPGWIWVDPDNGLLPNWLDGNPCCLYSVENSAAAQSMVALVDEFLAQPDDRWPLEVQRMTEVRDGPRIEMGRNCVDPKGDVVGSPVGGPAVQDFLDLVEASVALTDTDIVVRLVFDTETGLTDAASQLTSFSLQDQYTVWLVDGEGEVIATLEVFGPVEWNTSMGVLDEDQGMHIHSDSLAGVTLDIEGNTFEQRWPRSVLEQKFSLVGLDAMPEDLEWFVTTGAGMGGPEWFDRCPDNLGHG
jgi:hypothetical protein